MSNYKKVLVAVDLTDEASVILEKARQTADQNHAELSLLHVVKPINYAYAGLDTISITRLSGNFEREAREFATKKLTGVAADFGISPQQIEILFGSPAITIRDHSQAIGADLIVLGTHGQHGMELLLGSTANGVLHGVAQDLLVVRIRDDN